MDSAKDFSAKTCQGKLGPKIARNVQASSSGKYLSAQFAPCSYLCRWQLVLDSTYFQECELVNDDFLPDSALKTMGDQLRMIRCVCLCVCVFVCVSVCLSVSVYTYMSLYNIFEFQIILSAMVTLPSKKNNIETDLTQGQQVLMHAGTLPLLGGCTSH